MDLLDRTCEACEGGVEPLHDDVADYMLEQVPAWRREETWIIRDYQLKNFVAAVNFLRDIADLAEDEGHHPDLLVHGYKNLQVRLSTHAIGGLSDNDFIMAAKVERLWDQIHE